jgi:nitrite reductase (NADH) large subunit
MRHVIVGNGIAGITAASELSRRQAGTIDVYTEEPYPYYFRPQLPSFLAGEVDRNRVIARDPSWYEERGITVHLSSKVARLLPQRHEIVLTDGTTVPYDRLLLATGAAPFVPPFEGRDKRGVYSLRTLEDALAIREYAANCERAVVIGGGLLGLESARGLKALGLSVSALEFAPYLLPRQLDEKGAAIFRHLVEDLGIDVAVGANTKAIVGDEAVEGVILHDGRTFPAQLVLVAAGVRCDTALAAESGLETDRGVVVDEQMRTSAPDVYCAGDAAWFNGRSWAIIPQAKAQAEVAAANMAGDDAAYEEIVPSTTLKIVGISLTSCGVDVSQDENVAELRRSDVEGGVYKKLVLRDDVAVQAMVIGNRSLARKLEKLVMGRAKMRQEEAAELLDA